MQKTIIFLILLLLASCSKTNMKEDVTHSSEQTQYIDEEAIRIPDHIGKHLAQLLINRADLQKSPIFPTLERVLSTEDLETKNKRDKIGAEDIFLQMLQLSIINNWNKLLYLADDKKLNTKNAKYVETYFGDGSVYAPNRNQYILSIIISSSDKLYVVNAEIEKNGQNYFIEKLGDELGVYNDFKQLNEELKIPQLEGSNDDEDTKYNYNTKFNNFDLEQGSLAPSPSIFLVNMIEALKNSAEYGSKDFFLTQEEYDKTFKDIILRDAKKRLETDTNPEDILRSEEVLENPNRDFEKYIVDRWAKLLDEIKSKTGSKNLEDVEITAGYTSMRTYPYWGYPCVNTTTIFSVKIDEEFFAFEYDAILLDGKWKIMQTTSLQEPLDFFQF